MQSSAQDNRSLRRLPPIPNGDACSTGPHTPTVKSPNPESKIWSRYHTGCTGRHSVYMDWSATRIEKKGSGKDLKHIKTRSLASFKDAEEQDVIKYLQNNKEFLDSYVNDCVPLEVLEKWTQRKLERNLMNLTLTNSHQIVRYKGKGHSFSSNKQIFMDLLKAFKDEPNEHAVLWELAAGIGSSMGVDAFKVYKLFPDHPTFVQYFVMDHNKSQHPTASKILNRADPEQVSLVLEIAKRGTCWRLSRNDDPLRFPGTPHSLFKAFKFRSVKEANHVMYLPVLTKAGKTSYVIEMWRARDKFTEIDEEISSNFLVWGSLSLHYCNMYMDKKRERNMSDFLLDVVKAIFEEMVSLDQLIKRILEFAQRLVNADRASLFLVDYRNFELVSTVFDLKFGAGLDRDMEKKEIRMPINRGIAGHVALSGETMNIPDAYSDYRFNREVDEATGYKTISILCMPIKVEGRVIGVVQMVNKRNDDNFGHEDEVAFEIFSTFFGLALHHARLYDRIMRKEQKYRVALEVLSYHNTCRENEVQTMLADKEIIDVNLNDFYLDPFKFDEFEKCKCVVTMFNDLFDLSNFDITTVTRFILTVKKNYRTVPYHNFDHGWSVAHAMYVILKNDYQKRFDYKMRLALFVACLCHDLDHRGYTNKYMSETASPLAAMYSTSTLEHHHFNITVTILQQDGHNIFSHISSEDYKEILGFIRQCILATDLAAFFPNLEKMKELCREDSSQQFSWAVPSHRDLAMAISMTSADLSASTKPWEIQNKTVKVIFEEFYDQGDKERATGRVPIPMMDRNKPDEQPASQVGFLSQICIPCYKILFIILPNTKPMLAMALSNLDRWQSKADRILRKLKRKNNKKLREKTLEAKDLVHTNTEIPEVKKELDAPEKEIADEEFDSDENCIEQKKLERQESKTIADVKSDSISWEEEEEFVMDEEKLRNVIIKETDDVTWIEDDEGIVVAKSVLKPIPSDDNKEKKN